MTQHPVDRLKQLLFDSEAQALSEVRERLSQSETRAERDRVEFANRLDAVFERAGTQERFGTAVALVLDRALRRAEVDRHQELSDAVAPLIVRTIKTEIHNSRDELVEALYPITGRMVKAYVASAVADMLAQINRRVDSNPLMLRLRSTLSGKSMAELALADANRPQVTELFLIRRGSGELVGRWPQDSVSDRDHVMSGVLAAINEFASEAFKDEGTALRQIDMGEARVYLRASPLYLLAAKCAGSPPVAAEGAIDSAFLTTIEGCHAATATGPQSPIPSAPYQAQLARLAGDLNDTLGELGTRDTGSRLSPALVLFSFIGLLVAGVIGWYGLDRYYVSHAHATTRHVLEATAQMKGYPVEVQVDDWASVVTLTGLAPDQETKTSVLTALRRDLPGSHIHENLSVLPGAHGQIGNAIENAGIQEALAHALRRLEQTAADVAALSESGDKSLSVGILERASVLLQSVVRDLRNSSHPLRNSREKLEQISDDLLAIADELSTPAGRAPRKREGTSTSTSVAAAARELAAAADHLASVTTAVIQASSVKRSLPKVEPAIVRAPDITAFERLSVFVRSHAIFFGEDLGYRDEARAAGLLNDLAKLMGETDAFLRVIGYTDGKGTVQRNDELSAQRAEKVAQALIERGVPAQRLIHIGRQNANPITTTIGEASTNRRVEFEIGFDGERVE